MYNPRNRTLKASSLSNRGYERSEHPRAIETPTVASTLTGCPTMVTNGQPMGDPFRVDAPSSSAVRGCSLRSYPRLLSVDGFTVLLRHHNKQRI